MLYLAFNRRQEYDKTLNNSKPVSKPCVFCTVPEIHEREIIGNDLAFAFPTNIPITEGHTLPHFHLLLFLVKKAYRASRL